jgi:hypothetical protein
MELTTTELKLSERAFDSAGNVISGRHDDPFFEFRKGNR